ncbi:hypothetical protein EZ428_12465 [Pedobacter frigiditerrae]|uniref:Uncharacterized protein n=1 Tax=Pedobacter frigiditerrae TaxID=2530452 RepID=A0A4V2MIE7_9SPHI|nr:hypothetical protein [Pedobacter frigiditerrae]TCC90096.1 hypothetical protein EZ428_12465 [Pedobacter frigiditerrae]
MKNLMIPFIILFTLTLSCKKDSDNSPDNNSRTLRYELSGNFTGSIVTSYTTASGGTVNETVTAIPWTKEIDYATNVTAAIIALSGSGGVAGQKVNLVIKRGGVQVGSTIELVAKSSGGIEPATGPAIVF